jgi:hypothetical protein
VAQGRQELFDVQGEGVQPLRFDSAAELDNPLEFFQRQEGHGPGLAAAWA